MVRSICQCKVLPNLLIYRSAAILLYHATEDRKKRIGLDEEKDGKCQHEDMSEDEKRLLRAIWLSRSVANYSRPKYKTLVERLLDYER